MSTPKDGGPAKRVRKRGPSFRMEADMFAADLAAAKEAIADKDMALEIARLELRASLDEQGACQHEVNVCSCSTANALEIVERALASRSKEKK